MKISGRKFKELLENNDMVAVTAQLLVEYSLNPPDSTIKTKTYNLATGTAWMRDKYLRDAEWFLEKLKEKGCCF